MEILAKDGEFATSTGKMAKVNGKSTKFDGAPEDSSGLVIASSNGDGDPNLFEVGETYDISWDGGRIDDAEIVRSDAAGDGGIVVFSGTDQNGEDAFVLWTPDFDLQGWYDDVDGNARFYTQDQQEDYTHSFVCFAAETRVMTPYGPVPVGRLRPGHRVMTQDFGPQVVRWVGRRRVAGHGSAAPVCIPKGSWGATSPLRLSQQHRVVLSHGEAELYFGAREVFVPAKALAGFGGVTIAPCARVTYVHLLLDAHHVIEAEGVACESLFLAPLSLSDLQIDRWVLPDGEETWVRHDHTARPCLTYQEARMLLGAIEGRLMPAQAVGQFG